MPLVWPIWKSTFGSALIWTVAFVKSNRPRRTKISSHNKRNDNGGHLRRSMTKPLHYQIILVDCVPPGLAFRIIDGGRSKSINSTSGWKTHNTERPNLS
ncbi:hypothetical protein MTP99_008810 [Tenebrio molitor]|nr:hypothetical protein MTP99_008810 [Tenebrio molitor]